MDRQRLVVSIEVLKDGFIDVRFSGGEESLTTMLGALQMASKRVKQKIDMMYVQGGGVSTINECVKKVTKDEAFKKYVEAGKKIQERLHAIQQADDVAVFEIPTHLLDKI